MTRAFISYSHQDEKFRVELEKHLSTLRREGAIDIWSDHCIRPGEEFDPAIAAALEASDLILLLISVDFLHSDYCSTIELKRALERHASGAAVVVPIILRVCDWQPVLGKLKALPTDGKAVTRWTDLDEAFYDVTQHLRRLLTARAPSPARGSTDVATRPESSAPARLVSLKVSRSSDLALPRTFTDEQRHDFLVETFTYVQSYFESSLTELQARNQGVTSRMTMVSPEAFKAIVFRDGKRVAGCYIRIGTPFGGSGIAYSGNETSSDNSYNEMLSVEADKHMLFMTAGMAMFQGGDPKARLTEEGTAEHLWKLFISGIR